MPNTIAVTGSVASPLSGARTAPMMLAVATMTVLLPPASACATASTMALRRANLSSCTTCWIGSATADMGQAPGKAPLVAAIPPNRHSRQRRAALSLHGFPDGEAWHRHCRAWPLRHKVGRDAKIYGAGFAEILPPSALRRPPRWPLLGSKAIAPG